MRCHLWYPEGERIESILSRPKRPRLYSKLNDDHDYLWVPVEFNKKNGRPYLPDTYKLKGGRVIEVKESAVLGYFVRFTDATGKRTTAPAGNDLGLADVERKRIEA